MRRRAICDTWIYRNFLSIIIDSCIRVVFASDFEFFEVQVVINLAHLLLCQSFLLFLVDYFVSLFPA